MIYISEDYMEVERLFREGAYTKRGDCFYFTGNQESDNVFSCVRLKPEFSEKRFEIETVTVHTDDTEENILAEEKISDIDLIDSLLYDFFTSLSYAENQQDVMIFEATIDLIKGYILEADFSFEENCLYGEFMNLFRVEGKVVEGYYEGNLVLTEVTLKNSSTGQELKSFDRINVCSNFHVEEEDEDQAEYMIECYLESMSEYDIKGIFSQLELFDEEKEA